MIRAPTPVAEDYFGYSVAISEDSALVGAHNEDTGAANSGAVYIL
jgi:hypothetical protein